MPAAPHEIQSQSFDGYPATVKPCASAARLLNSHRERYTSWGGGGQPMPADALQNDPGQIAHPSRDSAWQRANASDRLIRTRVHHTNIFVKAGIADRHGTEAGTCCQEFIEARPDLAMPLVSRSHEAQQHHCNLRSHTSLSRATSPHLLRIQWIFVPDLLQVQVNQCSRMHLLNIIGQ